MKSPRLGLLLIALSKLGCSGPPAQPKESADAPAPLAKRLLIVHSYHAGYEWTAGIQRGIDRALAGASEIEVGIYYMDTKRNSDPAFKAEAGHLALEMTAEWRPDVVITSDDNAQAFFSRHLAGRDDVQVVFCGVNAEPGAYGFPAKNVTGLLERSPVEQSVALLDKVAPRVRRLALVADDSPTSNGGLDFFRTQPSHARVKAYVQPHSFDRWKRTIRRLRKRVDAIGFYTYHTVIGPNGKSITPREVMEWTTSELNIPTFSLFSFGVDDGALLGYVNSSYETGLEAGTWARELLHGAPIDNFPITANVRGRSMINLVTARALGLKLPRALVDSIDVRVDGVDADG